MKKITRSRSPLATTIGVAALVLFAAHFRASALTWDITNGDNTVVGGSGNWDNVTTTNWTNDGGLTNSLWSATNPAVFGGATGTVTLQDNISAGNLTFDTVGYSIVSNAAETLTLSTAAQLTANVDAAINSAIVGTTLTIASGSGVLTLGGDNTGLTGIITINSGGTLKISHAGALGTTAGGTVISSGGTLDLNSQTVGAEGLTVNGTGVGANGALVNTTGTASHSGTVSLASNSSIGGAGDLTLSGVVSATLNTQTITKVGAGKLTLSNTNTWGGSTTAGVGLIINNGTVEFTVDGNLGNVNNDITFGGGTLRYANAGADWAPASTRTFIVGASTGTLDVVDAARTVTIGTSQITEGATGTLIKAGAGTLSITNALTGLDGVLRVDAGTLRVSGNASALGDATNRATLNMNGGALLIQDDTARAFLNNLAINATTTITLNRVAAGAGVTHTMSGGTTALNGGTLTLAAGANVTSGTAALTLGSTTLGANQIIDTGASTQLNLGALNDGGVARTITKNGTGTLQLGSTATAFGATSSVDVTNGRVQATAANALGTSTVNVTSTGELRGTAATTLNGATINLSGGTVRVFGNGINSGGNLVYTSGSLINDRGTSGGAATNTMGTLSIGAVLLTPQIANFTSTPTLAFGATTLTGNAIIDTTNSIVTLGAITGGANTLTKQGANTLNLTAAPVSGNLTVSAGLLDLGASIGTYSGTLNVAATSTFEFNGGTFSAASAIVNNGQLNASNSGGSVNVTISGDYTGGAANRIDLRNTAGNLDGTVVTTEFLINNGDAYNTGTGVNVINNLRYQNAAGNFTVAGAGTSVYLSGNLRFVPANGQPWIVVRDGGKFVFGSGYSTTWDQGGNNRATRIGGNSNTSVVDFEGDAGRFLGNGTAGAQIGLITLITRAATNTFNSGAAFGFHRDNAIWQIRDNSQTFNGGTITFGDLFGSTSGRLVDVDVDAGLTMTFGTSAPVFQTNTRFRKTANTGTINFNNLIQWPTQGAQIELVDGRIQSVTVTANNVLSANWSTVTNAPVRGTNGVNFATGAIVAHQNNTTATMGGLGTAADLFFGLGTDYSQNVSLGAGTAWSGMSTDAVSDRRYSAGTITLSGDITLQGINGKVLIVGDGVANSAAPTFAGGFGLTIGGTVRFDDPDLNLSGVTGITFNAGANLQLTASVGGDITLFYGNLTGLGTAPVSALSVGQLKFKGTDNVLLTEQASGSVSLTATTGLARIGKGTLVVQPSATGVLGTTNKLLDSTQGADVALVNPYVIRVVSQASDTADFLKYDFSGGTGFVTATYGGASIDTAANTDIYATGGESMSVANAAVRALKVGGNITQAAATSTTLTIGGAGDTEAGIIGNATATIGADGTDTSTIAFTTREAVVYTKSGTTLTIGSTTTVTGTGGLTKFGAGTLTLAGNNSGLSGTITVNQGTLGLNSAPAGGTNFTLGPSTTLSLKSDTGVAFGNLAFDNVAGSSINVTVAPITSATDQTLSFTGTTTVGSGQTLNVNSSSSYNLGVTNLVLASNSTVNLISSTNGTALIVSGTYSDTASSVVQTQRYGGGLYSGLVFEGAGAATVNATVSTNGDLGSNQLTAIGRTVSFNGTINHVNSGKNLGAYDGGSITVGSAAVLDTYNGNNWRRVTIGGNGLTVAGAGASVIMDATFDTLNDGDLGAVSIGNLAIFETRNTNNFNNNIVPRGQDTGFNTADGLTGIYVDGQWLVTTASQTYGGPVTVSGAGDGNLLFSNGTIKTDTDLTLSNTGAGFRILSGKVFEKLGTGTLTLAKLDATGTSQMLVNKGAIRISAATGNANIAASLADDATVVADANNFTLTLGSLAGGGATGGNVTLGTGSLVLGDATTATYSGVISGSAAGVVLTKSGSGMQTLASANTYVGDTLITAGTLALSGSGTLGSNTGAALTVNGGTAIFDLGGLARTVGAVTLGGGGQINNGTLTGSAFAVESGSASAILAGAVALTKTTGGTVTLFAANTYAGATAVNGGTLVAANAAALGATTAGTTVASGATLDVQASLAPETISVEGAGVGGLGALVASAGTGTVAGLVTLTGNASIGGAGTLNVSGGIAGAFTVTKVGAGTTHLSGTHTFSTLTTSAGTTNVDSALATTATVNANATTNFTVSQTFGALNIGTVALANPLTAFSGSEGGTHLSVAAVPEPGSIALLLVGALGLGSRRRRNK